MKANILPLLTLAAILCACSPYITYIPIDMQGPSITNNYLWNKSIAVTYDEIDNGADKEFQDQFVKGFARGLENVCSNGKNVQIYKLPQNDSSYLYNTKLGMLRLMMELDADVVIHIPETVVKSNQLIKYIYLYDSKSTKDKVTLVKKLGDIPEGITVQELVGFANSFGFETSLSYMPNWIHEDFPIYASNMMGDNLDRAYEAACNFNWKEAISLWMTYTKDDCSPEIKSKAAFNLAVGCFFEGQYGLAIEWLDYSDKLGKLPESDNLRKKFELYIN